MPLVDYGSSDEETESVGEAAKAEETVKNEPPGANKPLQSDIQRQNLSDFSNDNNVKLFSNLPKPTKNISFFGDDNGLKKLLLNKTSNVISGKKNETGSVKISVPSISDFEDEDKPAPKKLKPSVKGVGLFSVLPPPKNNTIKEPNRTLVPNSVVKNHFKQAVTKEKFTDSKYVKPSIEPSSLENNADDEDIVIGDSFFGTGLSESVSSKDSLNEKVNETVVNNTGNKNEIKTPIDFSHPVTEPEPTCYNAQHLVENDCQDGSLPVQETVPLNNNPLELDEKALQILCGGKKKRQQISMNMIDLSGEEIMPNSKEWLIKQLTEERKVKSHSHRKSEGPSSQQRRKHQITYLAFQAKEQELELQNQWANNRMSKKQTQSKYGF